MSRQLSFADHVVSGSRSRRMDQLAEITGLIEWGAVEVLLRPLRPGCTGRPPYPPLVMFRALLLQRWYALSDEALEDALSDRLSFRRFVGLGLEDQVPDASTLCRFRTDVAVAEPRRQPGGGRSKADPEAGWAKKDTKATFGYKLHIGVDHGSGLVRAARLTAAAVADCTVGPDLVQGDEGAVYADMAYDNAVMRERLAREGIVNAVMHRPNRHHPLSVADKARNDAIGVIRGRIEGGCSGR